MKKRDILGLFLVICAVSLAGTAIYYIQTLKKPSLDPITFCSEQITAATTILIDRTDPFTPAQQASVKSLVSRERDALAQGALLSIYVLKESQTTKIVGLEQLVSLCHPGAEANALYENVKQVASRFENSFIAPINNIMTTVNGETSASSSPIAESLSYALDRSQISDVKTLKLVLVTDLMEHTPDGSAYDGTITMDSLAKLITPLAQSHLKNTIVEIFLLNRPALAQKQNLAKAAWLQLFKTLGAKVEFEN